MGRYLAIFALLCCASRVLSQDGDTRIVGGISAPISRYSFVVQVLQSGQMLCTGMFVSRRCVLTSANCIAATNNTENPENFSVRVRTESLNEAGTEHALLTTEHAVSALEVHPNFNRTSLDSDLAILVLTRNLTPSLLVSPVEVALNDAPDNASVAILGWGRLHPNSPEAFSPTLQIAEVTTISREQCRTRLPQQPVTDNMFCTVPLIYQGYVCAGDKGGPVLHNGSLAGLVSVDEHCSPNLPSVNVRVPQFRTWISDMVKKHNSGHTLGGLSATLLIFTLLTSVKLNL